MGRTDSCQRGGAGGNWGKEGEGINQVIYMYWVGQNVCMDFFHKIEDTFFIFTNNFIDLDILSRSTISCYWLLVCRGQGCC